MPRPVVIIPAYNSASTLAPLLANIRDFVENIIVVNDGSDDETFEIARSAGAIVIGHEKNMGKGKAVRSGFARALEGDYDSIITMDSDGQHRPEFIPSFLAAFRDSDADLIIGSRKSDLADMPWDRRFSNWMTSHLLSALLRTQIEDSQCGFRLYRRNFIMAVEFESDRFEIETEAIIKAVQRGYKIKFIPIKVNYGAGFPTNINPFIDTWRWCRKVLEFI